MRGSFRFSDLVLVFLLRLDGLRSILVFFFVVVERSFFFQWKYCPSKKNFLGVSLCLGVEFWVQYPCKLPVHCGAFFSKVDKGK